MDNFNIAKISLGKNWQYMSHDTQYYFRYSELHRRVKRTHRKVNIFLLILLNPYYVLWYRRLDLGEI